MKLIKTSIALATCALFAATAYADAVTDRIRETGRITIAYREASIPFSYLNNQAQPIGFALEIAQKIAENVKTELGLDNLEVVYQPVTSNNRIPLMTNGTIQLECGSTTNNTTRAREVDFSVNYFYTGTRFLVNANSGIQSIEDLNGKILVSTLGTTNLELLRRLNATENLGINIVTSKDHDSGFLNVQQGNADAFAMDDILLFGLRAAAPSPDNYAVVGEALRVEPYACMTPKDNPDFKAIVDNTIIALMNSGEFTQMYNTWFLEPIPPRNLTLGLPMSAELQTNLTEHSDQPAN